MKIGSTARRNDHLEQYRVSIDCVYRGMDIKSISQQDLLEKRVLGFVVRHPVVDLSGIHDEDVADDGDNELRDPVAVTEKKNLSLDAVGCD